MSGVTEKQLNTLAETTLKNLPTLSLDSLLRSCSGLSDEEVKIIANYIIKNFTIKEILDTFADTFDKTKKLFESEHINTEEKNRLWLKDNLPIMYYLHYKYY